jgi:hypothetical protein
VPERDTEQCRTKHHAKTKRSSIEVHNPISILSLGKIDKLRVVAQARDIIVHL